MNLKRYRAALSDTVFLWGIVMFACPVCGGKLKENKFGLACKKGHRFDAAAQGYVNLLSARHDPGNAGDNAMMVAARTGFLETGHYRRLADRLAETAAKRLKGVSGAEVVDCGCGEGYYTNICAAAMPDVRFYGIDLAKSAVRHGSAAAKAQGLENVRFAAASAFELPFAERSADLLISVFAPVAAEEFRRVLKKGGSLVIVCPSPEHLFGMKSVLYENPYKNKPNEYGLKGFAEAGSERLEYDITLASHQQIMDLYAMTPYYYKTPAGGRERLEALETLDTKVGFDILTYRKK